MSIMITGATGQLGNLIIKNLLTEIPATEIIAGVRNLDKSILLQDLKDQGGEVRCLDYDRPETFQEAFSGVSKLLLISSSHTDDTVRLTQHTSVIQAARKAGVPHILYTGFAFPQKGLKVPVSVHRLTEQVIFDSGMKYTILRNGLYIDFVDVLGLNEAMRRGVLATPPGHWRFNAVTRSDLARAIATVLAGKRHEQQIYELTAPENWTFADLANVLTAFVGKSVIHTEDESVQHWIYSFLSSIDTVSTSKDLEKLMGQPVTSLEDSIAPFLNLANL